ncbi:MAG: hypothetical protein CMN87_12270 [Stappia sp.]|uniref:hypothetical protein n=1 Tax=Stappia sp. TaxID=1870903 RepID=UPI000C4F4B88|nr:hypothetical protein [Stappia sp.]MAB00138.1 hypothetical protein [Stappia sp.]MBM20777.1 hypothetical protein [Stappia sp.]|tara:strand:- start:1019 stop:1267 length:249 start_codon:yes stop_codon:yes gene_type:complete
MNSRWPIHPCACAFAKTVDDRNPRNFPRVGMVDNVLYRGSWIIRHSLTGQEAVIRRPGGGPLHAEADDCCFDWFANDQDTPS